jgi:hypothetical protein
MTSIPKTSAPSLARVALSHQDGHTPRASREVTIGKRVTVESSERATAHGQNSRSEVTM